MKNSILALLIGLIGLIAGGCSSSKDNNLAYFKNLPADVTGGLPAVSAPAEIIIAVDDELMVTITSSAPEATAMFNAPLSNPSTRGDGTVQGSPRLMTHIVDRDGQIELPLLGRIAVAGKTTAEVERIIRERIATTVRDPYVSVQMAGFYVNVMGEVKQPQRVRVDRREFSVLDALAACGDLTEFGLRDGVVVIRRDANGTTYHRINLSDTNLFTQPAFYLRQNDVVYVAPNNIRIDNSKYNQNNAFKLSMVSTITGAVSVIVSLVIALAVR